MNTAQWLEAITDEGKFESLATSVLRKANKDYARLLHPGINSKGKTRKSRRDILGVVPGSVPPTFLLGEHTITKVDGLKRKWLYDHTTAKSAKPIPASKDGDLLKLCRKAKKLRKRFPSANFILILTTNIRPPEDLVDEVYEKAAEFGLSPSDIDIWDQSRIADFLDTNPEGQYLRKDKKYLGIDAEMLSKSLLHDLCKQSLANYEKQFLTNPKSWVSREIESQIEKGTYSNAYTIQLLIGESGSGKSAAAYQILKKHLASGGYGLWISDELLKECTLIENAIDRVLRKLYPSLLPDAGRAALRFIQEGSRLLLIVDDVNRTDNPTRLLQKLINWFKPQQSGTSDSQPIFSPYLVVCPVWSKVSSPISPDFKEKPWINPVFINSMKSEEGMAAIQSVTSLAGIEITNTEATSLAKKLGNDPILIGLFYELLLSNPQQYDLERFTENVIEQFITTTLSESSNSGTFLKKEYRASLSTVATQMLTRRKLYPLWTDIGEWLRESPDKLTALRELIKHKALCRLTQEDKFVFRHDRIQETLLVESMTKLLADTTPDSDILYEPFYAEIIGQAIARSPQSREFLRELRNRLPLALVEAIRCFGNPITDYQQAIIEEVKEWANSSVAPGTVPESILSAVCWILVQIDSPAVLDITEAFPVSPLVLLARLRNGSTKDGIRYCLNSYRYFFEPSSTDPLRDQVLEQAKCYQKEKLLRELKQILQYRDATDEFREAALILAGFLGFSELEDEVAICWKLATNQMQIIRGAIWAAVQCSSVESEKLPELLVAYLTNLKLDEKDSHGVSLKAWFVEDIELRWTLARSINSKVINYFISQCNVHESLRCPIAAMCSQIDHPDVFELVLKNVAAIKRSEERMDELSSWEPILFAMGSVSFSKKRRLSQPSMERLKVLWENPENDDFLRQKAFRIWFDTADKNQLEVLRAVQSNSPFFYEVLRKRMELGDQSVVKEILPLIEMEVYWFQFAHHVWCDDFMVIAQYYLEAFKENIPADFLGYRLGDHFILSRLLTLIPVKDAEMLLDKYWKHLGYSPDFIQTALYVGTPKCLELATSSISRCPTNIPIFKFVSSTFGCLDHERQQYMTLQHLERLLPYLDRLDERVLWTLAQACRQIGIPKWSQQHLSSRLSEEHRKRFHPSDDDLLQELDELVVNKHGEWQVRHWLEEFDKRHDSKSRALTLVDCWLAFNPAIKGLQIATACIQAIGTRKDLSILDQYTIEGSPDEIAKIKESTRLAVYRRSLD